MENLIEIVTGSALYYYRVDSNNDKKIFATISASSNISRINPSKFVTVEVFGTSYKTALPFSRAKNYIGKAYKQLQATLN